MKNTALFLLLCIVLATSLQSIAQQKKCITFESLQDFRSKTPGAASDSEFETGMKAAISANAKNKTLLSNYTIPIIFHIIHEGEAVGTGQNLSATQIQQQLAQLNADFANASGSQYAVAANANIQFSLAVIDPQGRKLAEPGIERINLTTRGWQLPPYDVMGYNTFVDANILPATIWNPYAYFNIWVTELSDNILGRSSLPSLSGLQGLAQMGETDTNAGVLLDYRSIGSKSSFGINSYWGGQGRTLTHEAGHFFGLRHIWGDGDCGNDYCGDTPTQKDFTEGCPGTLTLTSCEPGVYRMYQNYMDYSYDNCVNTFTADQVARMQAVMQRSPRRMELAEAGTDVAPAYNTVQFENVSFSFSENGVNTSFCPAYREVHVPLNLFDGAQDIFTLQFISNGTAQQGIDYELVTPTLTFNPGEATKTLVLRIYDDAETEADENIVLQYTISGSGAQPAPENQTLNINIKDNDGVTAISRDGLVTLMQEDFDGNGGAGNKQWQTIFFNDQDRVNHWTIWNDKNPGFTGQFAYITNNTNTKANGYNFSSAASVGFMTGLIDARSLSDISLSFKYKCEGELFYGRPYDYGSLFYSFDGQNFYMLPNPQDGYSFLFVDQSNIESFHESLGAMFDNKPFYIGFIWNNDEVDGTGSGFMIDDIKITAKALAVGRTAGDIGKQTILTGQSILLKNPASTALIAKIENASADLGCVTATISQAGNGVQPIVTEAGSFQRTQKVVQISPQHQTAATVTLYFTDAELAQWANAGELKVLKVKDGISLSGVLTARDAELITPVVTQYAAEGYTAYTFTVTSFSQFMLVSPTFTLPVKLVKFEAKGAERRIEIAWQTTDEKENKGFLLEKSSDGTRYEKIAWVPANNNNNYNYIDRFVQPSAVYYYRLQQVDFSGRHTYSAIRQAQVEGLGINMQVAPNPVSGSLNIMISGQRQPLTLKLLDAGGNLVGHWQHINTAAAPFSVQMAHLPKGVYTLLAFTTQGIISQKIIKQ